MSHDEPDDTTNTTSDAAPAPRTMFDVDDTREREAHAEMRRMATRRIAVWGLATGAVMAVIVAVCLVLLLLATQSSSG